MIRAALLIALIGSAAGAATAPDVTGIWSRPGASPCAQPDGSNPCWTAENTPERVLAAREAGLFAPDELCDGDVIANSYSHAGRAHEIARQVVDFDRAWLAESGIVWRRDAHGRSCIPTESFEDFHFVPACGNRVRLLERGAPPAAGATAFYADRDVTRGGFHEPFLAANGEGRGRAVTPLPPLSPPFGTVRIEPASPDAPTVPAVSAPSAIWALLGALGALLLVRIK